MQRDRVFHPMFLRQYYRYLCGWWTAARRLGLRLEMRGKQLRSIRWTWYALDIHNDWFQQHGPVLYPRIRRMLCTGRRGDYWQLSFLPICDDV